MKRPAQSESSRDVTSDVVEGSANIIAAHGCTDSGRPSVRVSPKACARAAARYHGLTDRRAQVLELLVADESHRQIARHLSVTVSTVDKHVEHIFHKFGVNSRYALLLEVLTFPDGTPPAVA